MIIIPNDHTFISIYTSVCNSLERDDDISYRINNDVYVDMLRKNTMLWYTDCSYKYICILRFKNFMGTVLAEIRCSEVKIFEMLDAFEQFFSFGMDSIPIPLEGINQTDGSYQMVRLERQYQDTPSETDPVIFSICSYRKETETITTQFSVTMSEDDFLSNFCYLLYFSYLIDIDEEGRGVPPIMI